MKSVYLSEMKKYTQKNLSELFGLDLKNTKLIIDKLSKFGAIKLSTSCNTLNDLSFLNENEETYMDFVKEEIFFKDSFVFSFVGIIIIENIVLIIYPKYLSINSKNFEKFKTILKVIEKFNSKFQNFSLINEIKDGSTNNLLEIILFLLNDYFEYGYYQNFETKKIINGLGSIDWNRTVNDTEVFLYNNQPIYFNIVTQKSSNNEFDFFTRLHKTIISLSFEILKECHILELFNISGSTNYDEKLEDFGEKEVVLKLINQELLTVFNTRKQNLLKIMYFFIENEANLIGDNTFTLFGSSNFKFIWQEVCSFIFNNILNKSVSQINLPNDSSENLKIKLSEIIEKPKWSYTNTESEDTYIPDLISIFSHKDLFYFNIYDAKYYNPILIPNVTPKNQPGIESITKQYMYQLAYKEFIILNQFDFINNYFVMPTEHDEIIDRGIVELKMLTQFDLQPIKIKMFPADKAFRYYLNSQKLSESEKIEF